MSGDMTRRLTQFITVVTLLFVPIASSFASHGNTDVDNLSMSPASDSAAINTCNEFVVTATAQDGQNQTVAAENEVIDIEALQSDSDTAIDLQIEFCDPGTTGTQVLVGQDCDDNAGTTDPVQNDGPCDNAAAPPPGAQNAARINGECTTIQVSGTAAECRFGVMSDEFGTMTVISYIDANDNDVLDSSDTIASNTAQKTWSGCACAMSIECAPASDSNPEGSRHEFQCTASNAQGQPSSGRQVTFDVTAGPNAQEVGPTNCGAAPNTTTGGTTTNSQGQTVTPGPEEPGGGHNPAAPTAGACGYNDAIGTDSPSGVDTITAYVNVTQPGATSGLDAGEISTTITKSWTDSFRTVDCSPEFASNPMNTNHAVTCIVVDASNQPVGGVDVSVFESGPGDVTHISSNVGSGGPQGSGCGGSAAGSVGCGVTNDVGQIRITTSAMGVTGTQTIAGDIATAKPLGSNQCGRAADDPPGAPAGVCRDEVEKLWTDANTTSPPPPPAPPPPPINVPEHERSITGLSFDHVRLPGQRRPALKVAGRLNSPAFEDCAAKVTVLVQVRAGGEWITRKSDETGDGGRFKVLIRDVATNYRALARKVEKVDEAANRIDVCLRAAAKKRHGH